MPSIIIGVSTFQEFEEFGVNIVFTLSNAACLLPHFFTAPLNPVFTINFV